MIGGDVVNDVPPKDRDIAMVFQNYALYPHMTVAENMSFGLAAEALSKSRDQDRVDEAARMLDIVELVDRKPKQLSGGQRQRAPWAAPSCATRRCFCSTSRCPTSTPSCVQMRIEIKKVHQKVRTTTVYVTHDRVEAMTLADRVVVMNHGRIEQIGTPNELYHKPATRIRRQLHRLAGDEFHPVPAGGYRRQAARPLTDRIVFPLPPARAARYQGVPRTDKLLLGLRPEHITEAKPHGAGVETFDTVLDVTEPMGWNADLFYDGGLAGLRPGPIQCRRAGWRAASIGYGPQQYAPAKRGDRRRPLTAQLLTKGRKWLQQKKIFVTESMSRPGRAL